MKRISGQADTQKPSAARSVLICLLLAGATAAVYGRTLKNDFVTYDDPVYITLNEKVQQGLTVDNVRWAFSTNYANFWHPVTWLSIMLDCELFGLKAWGHHLSALCLHIANTILLFIVLVRMTRATWRSAFVAAMFALHPLHVESVAWASQRKDLLSTFFWLATMWAYAAYADKTSVWRYVLVAALFVLGLMTKPMLVTLPFVLLLMDYWPLGRFNSNRVPGKNRLQGLRAFRWRIILEKLPLLAIAAVFCVIAYKAQKAGGAITIEKETLSARVENAALSYGTYVRRTFWPTDLTVFYPWQPTRSGWAVAASLALLAVVTLALLVDVTLAAAIHQWRRRPYLLVGWLWYLGVLVPVIGLVRVGSYAMADRFTYVAQIGLGIMLAWGAADLLGPLRAGRKLCASLAAALLITWSAFTYVQLGYWKDSYALFQHALDVTTNNNVAHTTLGYLYGQDGDLIQAEEHYRKAIKISPTYPKGRSGYADIIRKLGRPDEALTHLQIALTFQKDPKDRAEVLSNIGRTMLDAGRPEEALKPYQESIKIDSTSMKAQDGLADTLERLGRTAEALPYRETVANARPKAAYAQFRLGQTYQQLDRYEDAADRYRAGLAIDENDVPALLGLGRALSTQGKYSEGVAVFDRALALSPTDHQVLFYRAASLNRLGRTEEAIAGYREALLANDQFELTLNSLAWALATSGEAKLRNGPEAVQLAKKACELTSYESVECLDTLAAAYAETGEYDEAVKTIQQAIETALAAKEETHLSAFRSRLELYRSAKPYHREDASTQAP